MEQEYPTAQDCKKCEHCGYGERCQGCGEITFNPPPEGQNSAKILKYGVDVIEYMLSSQIIKRKREHHLDQCFYSCWRD